ncbi:Protein BCP1 [Yarrowia sp. B02]|nr:Protein BCP1 [Yarrowia sp. B02]
MPKRAAEDQKHPAETSSDDDYDESYLEEDSYAPDSPDDPTMEDDEDIPETIDVDFEYFDFNKDIDYHAIGNLLRQLLDSDSTSFNLSELSDMILEQESCGTTIKTDGKESDPFAILTVLNMSAHKDNKKGVIAALIDYFVARTQDLPELHKQIRKLLGPSSTSQVGLIISERLINMPVQVVPPMYKMLLDETKDQDFDYFLVLSKTFTEAETSVDEEDERPSKKNKKGPGYKPETYYFHPEDEVIQEKSTQHGSYAFAKASQEADSKRAFQEYGIFPKGHLMLFKAKDLEAIVFKMEVEFAP